MGCNCKKSSQASSSQPHANNAIRTSSPSVNGRRNGKIIRRIIK